MSTGVTQISGVTATSSLSAAQVALKQSNISSKLRFVGDRSVSNIGTFTPTSGTGFNCRTEHIVNSGVSEIIFEFYGFYDNGSGVCQNLPNAFNVTGLFGMGVSANPISPVTFNGQLQGTCAIGGVLRSDPIAISANGNSATPLTFYANWFASCVSGGQLPGNQWFNGTLYPNSSYSNTSTETDQTQNQTYLPVGGNYAGTYFGPTAVIGRMSGTRKPSWAGFGDSITWGLGYWFSVGWPGMAFMSAFGSVGAGPYGNCGEPTAQASSLSPTNTTNIFNFYSQGRQSLRKSAYADAVLYQMGTNDLAQGFSLAQVQSYTLNAILRIMLEGVRFIAASTILPRASASTNNYITDAGQTVQTAWLPGGASQLYNAWLRDGMPLTGSLGTGFVAALTGSTDPTVLRSGKYSNGIYAPGSVGHPVGIVIDPAITVESTAFPGAYISAPDGTTATAMCTDGIHPSQTACVTYIVPAMVPPLNAYTAYITPYLDI